jgi:hypothetical protein
MLEKVSSTHVRLRWIRTAGYVNNHFGHMFKDIACGMVVNEDKKYRPRGIAGLLGGNSKSQQVLPAFVLKRVHRRQPNAEEF